jgi:hypothetical protein
MFQRDADGVPILMLNPLASNHMPDGKTLFTKVHGVKASFTAGETKTLEFTIPYTECYFTGAEIVFDVKSTANMEVTHPTLGTIEQYGYSVNEGAVQYTRESKYGAALQGGLVLKCEVTNNTADALEIGANFLLIDVRTPV